MAAEGGPAGYPASNGIMDKMVAIARQALAPAVSRNFRMRFMASRSVHRRWQCRKRKRGEEELVHVVEYSKTLANRVHDKCTECKGGTTILPGTGRWQMLLPTSFLRCAFEPPAKPSSTIGASYQSTAGHVVDIRQFASRLLVQCQKRAINDMVLSCADRPSHVVLSFMWDETKLKVKPNDGSGKEHPVLAMHGGLAWAGNEDRTMRRYDIVCAPAVLTAASAECIWRALCDKLPVSPTMSEFTSGTQLPLLGVATGADNCGTNHLVIKHILNNSDDSVLVLPGPCRQHLTALCLRPLAVYLDLLCPVYCVAKKLSCGRFFDLHQECMRETLRANFVWLRESEHPDWKPDPEDVKFSEQLLNMSYVAHDLTAFPEDTKAERQAQDRLRRERGRNLLRLCPGSWKSTAIIHWCRGCCESREQAIDLCTGAIEAVFGQKWSSLLLTNGHRCGQQSPY